MTMHIEDENKKELRDKTVEDGTITPDEDKDLMSLLNGKHIYKEYDIAKKMTVKLRDLKTGQWLLARRMATVGGDQQELKLDYTRLPVYNLALSIVSLKIDGKNVELTPLYEESDRDNISKIIDSLDARSNIINLWPPSVLNTAIDAFDNLVEYVTRISSAEKLSNF